MHALQRISASSFSRHNHDAAYAAVVLAGGYEEVGDHGRFQVAAGDVLLHDRFEAHLDRFSALGAVILNLGLPAGSSFGPGVAKIADPDLIVRAAERSQTRALQLLLATTQTKAAICADWPDELAARLIDDPSLQLGLWAEAKGLNPWTVSRGFAQVFGVPPEVFRARARARQAWRLIQTSKWPLAQIAYDLGFADQSHMGRSVKRLTGESPGQWRGAANRYKTRRAPRM
jgi:AraC-like DNA-binding protein